MLFWQNPSRALAPQISFYALVTAVGLGLATAPNLVGFAFAETHEEDGTTHTGGPKGPGGKGGGGHTTDGHDTDGHDSDSDDHTDHEGGQGGQGRGGQGAGRDGEGGNGSDGGGSGGQQASQNSGRPVWAQEGIPDVELGRLNVARSPNQVLDRAYHEALGSMTPDVLAFYGNSLEGMIEQLSLHWDEVNFVDSPLQNLALLREALEGQSVLTDQGINSSNETLMAAFLGTASDKSIPITTDTVLALATILKRPITSAAAAALAKDAERVRIAILAGHG